MMWERGGNSRTGIHADAVLHKSNRNRMCSSVSRISGQTRLSVKVTGEMLPRSYTVAGQVALIRRERQETRNKSMHAYIN